MPYAQKNYPQIQGINGQYTIASIGCFLTSFCNLESDYGKTVDPVTLNAFFTDNRLYIDVDDGIRDDLGWDSITQYDPNTTVVKSVDHGTDQTAGWPGSNEAIVRFHYQSISHPYLSNGLPNYIYHFCKVVDITQHLIIDSWDGVIKKSPYGEPTAWAEYTHKYQEVAPPAPPYSITHVDPYQVTVTPGHHQWDLSHTDWNVVVSNPLSTSGDNQVITVQAHLTTTVAPQYTYLLEDASVPHGWNKLDTTPYIPPAKPYVPPAAPIEVKRATKVEVVTDLPYYDTSMNAKGKYKEAGKLKAGTYYQISSENGMWNLSSDNMKDLQHWVNPSDNVAPEPPKEEPKVESTPGFEAWKATYQSFNANRKPVKYVMMQTYTAQDFGGNATDRVIKQYTELPIYGTFKAQDGRLYGRLKLASDTEWKYWYGVPMIPEVVELEQEIYNPETDVVTRQATKQLTFRDYEILALDKVERVAKSVEHIGGKFIDGVIRRKKH